MLHDEPIEEIRKRRRELFKKKYHGSIDELIESGKKYQKEHPEKFADFPKKKLLKKAS